MEEYGKEFLGRGFHFPIGVDPVTGRFRSSSYEDSIREAIYIILMTRKGERVMQPEFGCDIYDFAFASLSYTTICQMEDSVRTALERWEPRIRDVEVTVRSNRADEGRVDIGIQYVVRSTNEQGNLVYPFYWNDGAEI